MERRDYYRRAVDRDRRESNAADSRPTEQRTRVADAIAYFKRRRGRSDLQKEGRDEKKAGGKTTRPSIVVMKMVGSGRECAASRQQVHEEQDDRNDEEH